MNYNQPWTTLGLAPQPQRENRDPNGSQGPANFSLHYGPREPLERPEEPFAIAVRDIDEYLGCSRLRWGSEAPRIRVRLENLDAIKPEGASSNAPFHPRGGE